LVILKLRLKILSFYIEKVYKKYNKTMYNLLKFVISYKLIIKRLLKLSV